MTEGGDKGRERIDAATEDDDFGLHLHPQFVLETSDWVGP